MVEYLFFEDIEEGPFSLKADEALHDFQEKILSGKPQEEILDYVFDALSVFVPFDRVGIAIQEGECLQSKWVKSHLPVRFLKIGYSAKISGSTLEKVLSTGKPRVIGDLKSYLHDHPQSQSTALIVKDGMRSSLTFPLQLRDETFGVVFFSSIKAHAYSLEHLKLLESVAQGLALVIERAELQRLKDKSKNQDMMLSKVLHDLRSPLAVMMSFTDLLESSAEFMALDESAKKLFSVIRRNEQVLWSLVDELSDLSNLKSNRLSVRKTNVILSSFISETMESLRPICTKKGIVLKYEIEEASPNEWSFDPLKLRQVLENLVSNAAKFSKPESLVSVQVWKHGDRLFLSVTDEGPGIPEEDLPKLFREFGVTNVQTTGGEKSTGLGLAICKQIVNAHGGEIRVFSQVNVGSCFEFWLPKLPKY